MKKMDEDTKRLQSLEAANKVLIRQMQEYERQLKLLEREREIRETQIKLMRDIIRAKGTRDNLEKLKLED